MNRILSSVALFAFAVCGAGSGLAQAAPQPCPISYSHLEMPYRHKGGISTPMVELSFTNETKKKIDRAKFGLIVIDTSGGQAPYDKALTFSTGADPGKVVSAEWALEMEKVNIERYGETIYLKSVRFDDNTTWTDDGNERCRQEVYYGPK